MSESSAGREEAILGCLLGTAVGDALGLPAEGLSRRRQTRLFGAISGHRFLCGRGMISDDTEHACMTAQAIVASAGDPDRFLSHLARELRRWLLALPAGVGFATLRATLKLLVGISPRRSGVHSAGNGPAMRSPILGVCYGHERERLAALVRASTRLTHTDPRAEAGALAVAVAAFMASHHRAEPPTANAYLALVGERLADAGLADDGAKLLGLLRDVAGSVERGESTSAFANTIGCADGVSGYVMHTVPVAIHAWLSHHRDYRTAVLETIRCGGDTDTTAAIVGGIVGAAAGPIGIPRPWIDGIAEWPRSVEWMEQLGHVTARVVAHGKPERPPSPRVPAIILRNVAFLVVVLAHGFRRLLPPY